VATIYTAPVGARTVQPKCEWAQDLRAKRQPFLLEYRMVTKLAKTKPTKASGVQLSGSVRDSAQQIWQAGLGALSKAQAEGTKAIEALVKEGTTLQRKTQAAAEEKISEATNKMSNMATDITSKATGQWDKLESIFEDRVAKALNKLGVPSAKDINALVARIDELNKSVQKLSAKGAAAPKVAVKPAVKVAAKPVAKTAKPAAKRVAARKAKVATNTSQA
jgi:poly(hydroxyalkanoate) granule-associated protein